jgi:hypothetical protein
MCLDSLISLIFSLLKKLILIAIKMAIAVALIKIMETTMGALLLRLHGCSIIETTIGALLLRQQWVLSQTK